MKTKKDLVFFAATACFAVMATAFTFGGGFNLGATLTVFVFLVFSACYLADRAVRPSVFSCLCGLLALLCSLVFSLSTDVVFRLSGIPLVFGLTVIFLIGLAGNGRYWQGGYPFLLDICRTVLYLPFAYLTAPWKEMGGEKTRQRNGKIGRICLGICAALPVLLLVIPLLISADAAFSGLVDNLLRNLRASFAEVFFGLLLTPFLFAALFAMRKKLDRPNPSAGTFSRSFRGIPLPGMLGFLGSISFCYLIYLFSQLAYFFNGFAGLLPEGWTVIAYAKRGFFEMSVLAAINLLLIFLSSAASRRTATGKIPLPVRILNLFLCLFTLLLIATAQSKMILYIRQFGMTRLRLLTSLFMWFLALVCLFVILRLFIRRFPYLKAIVAAGALLFLLPWAGTPVRKDLNSLVCSYNLSSYMNERTKNKNAELDINYLCSLGRSATPYLIEISQNADLPMDLRQRARQALTERKATEASAEQRDFRAYNRSTETDRYLLKTFSVP